ncbi:TPA: hypothetical protein ACKRTE_002318 [Providencia rettgeri]
MNLPINNLSTLAPSMTSNSALSTKQTMQQKMALASLSLTSLASEEKQRIQLKISPEEKMKIDNFINQLEQKSTEKEFFAYFFKTMTHLNKKEKENFIAGTLQTLKLRTDESSPSLNKLFSKTLKRYMSISLMSSPLSVQFNRNIGQIKLESDDDDDIEGI